MAANEPTMVNRYRTHIWGDDAGSISNHAIKRGNPKFHCIPTTKEQRRCCARQNVENQVGETHDASERRPIYKSR